MRRIATCERATRFHLRAIRCPDTGPDMRDAVNNQRGADMVARLRTGQLVTIRLEDGSTRTGRPHKVRDGWCICSGHPGSIGRVTADNIISIQER